ncbi:MAG: hypothetical protein KAW56_03420 [Candidatus Marinimicrobia bacterium]|nr:hypothetical protein [Candidatus Neomarinimicrobiota bacterium]
MREMDGLILRNDGGTAYNRAYLASAYASAQIGSRWSLTSGIRGTLVAILLK